MKLNKEKAIEMLLDEGPAGARAKFGTGRADNYHLVIGQWQAGAAHNAPTENNWTILAIRKDVLEMDPLSGLSKCIGGALVLEHGGSFNTFHGNAHQMMYQDGLVWYWDMD